MDSIQPAFRNKAYRPDIDGLRAIAVLAVIANHLAIPGFGGGFIGVDVFFVLSGYLISAILLREHAAGTFSFARFYERRFRRILPALLVMLLISTVLAYKFLLPLDLRGFAQTELGALASVSNVVLLHQTGYFDTAAKEKILLHTWSLGVEEQFYIVFPVVLLAIVRLGRRHLRLILWLLTAAFFALALYGTSHDSSAAFFLAPYRAWELLCGILLAANALPSLSKAWHRNLAAATGLALILWATTQFSEAQPYPGWRALVPCLGAVLLLAAGGTGEITTWVGRVLAWTPLRAIGLISYSLYLWHWPMQVFQANGNILVPDRTPLWATKLVIFAASLVAATLSWRFVEQPFRTGRLRARLPLFALNGALFALLLVLSASISSWQGFPPAWVPFRSALFYSFVTTAPLEPQTRWGECFVNPETFTADFKPASCLAPDPARKQYLVLGDSHASHLYVGLKEVFPELNFSMIAVTGCPPTRTYPPWRSGLCDGSAKYIYGDYLEHHHPDAVILIGRWFGWDVQHLQDTTDWFKARGIKVIVVGPNIEFDEPLLRLVELSKREHDPQIYDRHRAMEPQQSDEAMQRLAHDQWHVPYISMYDDLCSPATAAQPAAPRPCPAITPTGVPVDYDTDHLSPAGAIEFARAMRDRHQLP